MADFVPYSPGQFLAELYDARPTPDSSAVVSFFPTGAAGHIIRIFLNVGDGQRTERMEEERLLWELFPASFRAETQNQMRIVRNGRGVTAAHPMYVSRRFLWLDRFGEQVANLWQTGNVDRETVLPALLAGENLSKPCRDALLTLLHLDQYRPTLTTATLEELHTTIDAEPEIGDVLVTIAEGNNSLYLADVLQVARTVMTP